MTLKSCRSAWTLVLVLLASCGTVPKTSVTEAPLGVPRANVDDSLFFRVLHRAIASDGRISYKELQSDTELTAYLNQIAFVRTDAFNSRSELLAFWINTHNAYVLDMIRSNPARSIDDISGFRYAKVIFTGDGRHYSLDDIEHTILEQQFREPRAFFALFDGTRSSPTLPSEPYSGAYLSNQLDAQFRAFLADSTKNYLDRRVNTLYLSQTFEDYSSTLEEMSGEPLTTLVRDFAPTTMEEWIRRHSNVAISYLQYDNTINTSDITTAPSYERKSTPPRRPSGGIR
jgi:Protein of unknown function, DUF547